jgi:hypothetical protein
VRTMNENGQVAITRTVLRLPMHRRSVSYEASYASGSNGWRKTGQIKPARLR